jgi:hypothetical protein
MARVSSDISLLNKSALRCDGAIGFPNAILILLINSSWFAMLI